MWKKWMSSWVFFFVFGFLAVASSVAIATPTISIPDTTVPRGTATVQIPINIDNAEGVAGFQCTVTYNPAVLQATAPAKGALISGWGLGKNNYNINNTEGWINIATYDPDLEELPDGGGSLILLNFNVVGVPGDTAFLTFTMAKITNSNAGEISRNIDDGSFHITGYSISGKVTLVGGAGKVTDVVLSLERESVAKNKNSLSVTTQPDGSGAYSFTDLPANYSYTITPQLTGYSFNPANRTYTFGATGNDVTGADFTGQAQAMVSGTVSYEGVSTGNINVGLFTTSDFTQLPAYGTQISRPGSYNISNVAPGTYYVAAYMDVDRDNVWDQGEEPSGVYTGNPLSLAAGQQLTGINITLKEPLALTVVSAYGSPTPAVGSHIYYTGDLVTASVVSPVAGAAGERYVCTGWTGTGNVPVSGNTTTVTFTITQDSSITWLWQKQVELTAVISPVGAGTVNGTGWYNVGATANITAAANANFIFKQWSGAAEGTNSSTSVIMDAPKEVTACFDPLYSLTVVISPDGGGTVAKDPSQAPYRSGTVVNITATANPGYRFVNWTGDVANPNSATTTVTMDGNKTVTANFIRQYTLTMAVSSAGTGTTTPAVGTYIYDKDTVVEITATANPGYGFVNWTGGVANPNSATTTVTMDGDKTVTANFIAVYTFTVVSAYGTPTPAIGEHPYAQNGEVTASVTSPVAGAAGERYVCTGWTGTGSVPVSGNTTTVTFTITQDSSITWLWQKQYSLKTDIRGSGSIQQQVQEPTGKAIVTTWYDELSTVELTAVPADDTWTFGYWEGDIPDEQTTTNPLTITMDGPKEITAVFLKKEPVLTVEPTELTFVFNLSETSDSQASKEITITNIGAVGDLEWEIKTENIVYNPAGTNWITTITPSSDRLSPGKDAQVTLTVNRGELLAGGIYTAIVPVRSNADNQDITVTMVIIQAPKTIEPPISDSEEVEAKPFIPFTAQFYRSTKGATVTSSNWEIAEIIELPAQVMGKQPSTRVVFSKENISRTLDDKNNVALMTVPWGLFKPNAWYIWRVSDNDFDGFFEANILKDKPKVQEVLHLWSAWSNPFQVKREVPQVTDTEQETFLGGFTGTDVDTQGAHVLKDPQTEELLLATLPASEDTQQKVTSITVEMVDPEEVKDIKGSDALNIEYMMDIRIEGVPNYDPAHPDTVVFNILIPGYFNGDLWKYNPDAEEWLRFFDGENLGTVQDANGNIYTEFQISLTDGGQWDFDGEVNGVIVDPLALGAVSGVSKVSGGGGCFIATAAFGSPFERHVWLLRQFRDRYLLTNPAGQAFVRWYYRHSPAYARIIAGNDALRVATRIALMPLYGFAYILINGLGWFILLLGASLMLAMRLKKKTFFLLLLILPFLFAGTSFAADINHFKVAPGEEATVVVPTTSTIGQQKVAVDFFYSYANNPLEGKTPGGEIDLIESQSLLNMSVTIGLSDCSQMSLTLPYVFNQNTQPPIEEDGFGDIILAGKYRFSHPTLTGASFALAPYIQFATGNEDALLGTEDWAAGIRGIFDKKINQNILLTANIGYAYQSKEKIAQVSINHSFLFGAGIVYNIEGKPSYITGEIYGRSEELFDSEDTPIEALISYGYRFPNATFVIGGAAGLVGGYGATDWRLFTGLRMQM